MAEPVALPPGVIPVATVGKPFGLRGEVYVFADADLGDELSPGAEYPTDRGTRLVVAASHVQRGSRRVVHFEGVADREQAEALRGTVLGRAQSAVPLEEGSVWVADLIGREVVDAHGELLGVVEAVADGAAHDYLLVARPDAGEVMLPFVPELCEVTAERVVVQAIPGLFDDGGL